MSLIGAIPETLNRQPFPSQTMIIPYVDGDADWPAHRAGQHPAQHRINVDWVTGVIRHMREHGLTRAECSPEGVAAWTEHVKSLGVGLLSNEIDSWMTGINRNVEGKNERIIARYSGSAPAYRARCDAVAEGGYREMRLG